MIIGITGKKRSGKDTTGEYLVDVRGFTKLSFAKPLKDVVSKYLGANSVDESDREDIQDFRMWDSGVIAAAKQLGLPQDKLLYKTLEVFEPFSTLRTDSFTEYRMTYRQVLQLFGTDVCRALQDDIWVSYTINKILKDTSKNYVITDTRFDNEAIALKEIGGRIVQVNRRGFVGDSHKSEKGVSPHLIDKVIDNTTFQELYSQLGDFVDA